MTFTSEALNYKAYTYPHSGAPITITEQTIKLVPAGNGTYSVKPNNILVKVSTVSLNPVDEKLYNFAGRFTSIFNSQQGIGRDYAGVVVAIGAEAAAQKGLKIGDRVHGFYCHPFGKGTLAEYILVDSTIEGDNSITKVAENFSLVEAASLPLVFGTAHTICSFADLKDKKLLVLGGNTSVGRHVIQLAKVKGAKEIVATCSSKSEPFVTKLGVNSTIDYNKESLANAALESVKETGEFDFIADTVGGTELFPQIKHILPPKGGTYVTIVGDYDGHSLSFKFVVKIITTAFKIFLSALGLSFYKYHLFTLAGGDWWLGEGVKLAEEGKIKTWIDSTYKWSEFDQAFDRLKSGKASGKIVIQVEDEE
ncbi:hypothetical protein G9P44_003251 [Scheffersomyces stipitis]|nr:hypothetical protein G9P44_003251 [Scheffersomyces stipitis]